MTSSKEWLKSPEYKQVLNYLDTMDFSKREVYAHWLAQTYFFVSHSVRLSALGASKCDVDDPIGKRMATHTIEENGHHLLARKDLKTLGYNVADLPCYGVTSAFYQSQYYKVLFEDPVYLLGQILVLESLANELGEEAYKRIKSAHGALASTFVKIHALEDKDHVEKAIAAVDSLPEHKKQGIRANFFQAIEMYYLILRTVNERALAAANVA